MTTLNKGDFFQERIIRSWQIAMAVGGGVLIGVLATVAVEGNQRIIDPGSALSSLGVPAAVDDAFDDPVDRTEFREKSNDELQGELNIAQHQRLMNQRALVRLQQDRRWQDEDQRKHLSRAMKETSVAIQRRRERIDALVLELSER